MTKCRCECTTSFDNILVLNVSSGNGVETDGASSDNQLIGNIISQDSSSSSLNPIASTSDPLQASANPDLGSATYSNALDASDLVTEEWVKRYSGAGNFIDSAYAMALDASGNVYVTGSSPGDGTNTDYATIKYSQAGSVSGTVNIQGRSNQSGLVTFELRIPGQTVPITSYRPSNDEDPGTPGTQITLSSDGGFTLVGIPAGTYDLTAKSSNTLRAKQANIGVTAGNTTSDMDFNLLGGDCDGNNRINAFDNSILNAAFGSRPGNANWNPAADLDNNGVVNAFDNSILNGNFGKFGAN